MQYTMLKLLALALTTAFVSGVSEAAPYKPGSVKIPVKKSDRTRGLDRAQAKKTILTYRQMIGLKSEDPDVCEWQGKVVNAMLVTGNQTEKSEEITKLVKVYLAHKKSGVLKGSKLEKCRRSAQGVTAEMSKAWHNEAIKITNTGALGDIEKLYQLYVQSFPLASDIGDMQYYYAELLWRRAEYEGNPGIATDRWEKAAIAFSVVVRSGKVSGKQRKESAYAAVLSWKNVLAVDPRTKAPTTTLDHKSENAKIPVPKPIGAREKKMIAAFDIYTKYNKDPADDELVMMKFLKARIYWRHDRLEDSLPLFFAIVERHPTHESALYSANILVDSLIRLKKYDEMNKLVHKLLTNKKLLENHDELTERLQRIKAIGMRKAAENLEMSGQHIACGQAYLDIYNASPDARGMDEIVYNAGVCFEDGKAIDLALGMYLLLEKRFPKSRRTQKGLVRAGSVYGSMAEYEKAAQKYEAYASRYGGERDAPYALMNAATYRKAIGMDKEAIKNIEDFVKKYKKKLKQEAADALFGLAGIYENQGNSDMVVKAYKRYIKEVGKLGGLDRLLIANAKIGEILWNQSCKTAVNGACVRIKRERATRRNKGKKRGRGLSMPTRCGPKSKIKNKLTLVPRSRRKTVEAQKYFKTALALVKKGAIDKAADPGRKAAAIYWMAASRFYMVEERYEKFLSLEFPTKLSYSPKNEMKKKDSTKRFGKWLEDKKKMAVQLNSEYGAIKAITGGGAAWAVAAAARAGQVSQNFSDELLTAEIPREVRTGPSAGEDVDAFCGTMKTAAAPLEDESVQAFGFCLNLSTALNWFNDWSRLCEKELVQMRPADFPAGLEVHAEPSGVGDIIDTAPLQKWGKLENSR